MGSLSSPTTPTRPEKFWNVDSVVTTQMSNEKKNSYVGMAILTQGIPFLNNQDSMEDIRDFLWLNCFLYFHPDPLGHDPTWRLFFQMSSFNHHLVEMTDHLSSLLLSLSNAPLET